MRAAVTRLVDWFSGLSCKERIHVYALGVMMVGSVAHGLLFSTYYIEDAGITFAYSRNLVEGEGLAPWAGSERVEGYSNPLWTFLVAAWYAIGVPVWTSSKSGSTRTTRGTTRPASAGSRIR